MRALHIFFAALALKLRHIFALSPAGGPGQIYYGMGDTYGNIGFGPTKEDTVADLAFLVGATVINEQLGDDLDLITTDCLGEAYTAITDDKNTVLTIGNFDGVHLGHQCIFEKMKQPLVFNKKEMKTNETYE